ncbi:hypothetical protein O181_124861 [Austropuccinia psidii MF-1]|uniref:Uncharacterized protein n=1 Tax=Austropuccinia psidii MF-1 TaxID=1389203 RepID=A0A9Q3KS01_9BASI|nr:hypothetical protein [Austropuccinia psidii MF-1]
MPLQISESGISYLYPPLTSITSKDVKSSKTPFQDLDGEIYVQVAVSEEISNKNPTFPVSLIKPLKSSDAEKFPLSNKVPQVITPIESSCNKKITKVLKERNFRTNRLREYLVRYSDPTFEDELLAEKDLSEATKLLGRLRHSRNKNITK